MNAEVLSERISVAFHTDQAQALSELARRRGLKPGQMARVIVAERLIELGLIAEAKASAVAE